ncbi:hypothetical protein BDW02DRAFT_561180 [Decorospora gaudefroyi]|uniref:Chromo domain-containing protein n=1 Tax=Decorospora gaudefroyi TaxID=184978 RepID=A0A6A5K7W6_9PLEO|nr:hypothetical protein BDW02DRAFT_561180 [Decorospora gaudefroyi]
MEDDVYYVEEILSERTGNYDGLRQKTWLVKWEGYGLDEGTWEPRSNFPDPDVLREWDRKIAAMSPTQAREYMKRNEEEHHAALHTKNCEKRARPVVADDDSDDDDATTSQLQKETDQQQAVLEAALASREAIDASQLNNLFIDSQDVQSPGLNESKRPESSVKHPSKARQSPVAHSESSSDEGGLTDDSMMNEMTTKTARRKPVGATGEARPKRKSAQSHPSLAKPATSAATIAAKTTGVSASAISKSAKDSVASTTQTKDNSVVPSTGASGSIKFVNQPKSQQRKGWQNSKKQYTTLHFRAVADKRSRAEGTPDPAALDFVIEPPGIASSKPRVQYDNPYARRQVANPRVQEYATDNDSRLREADDTAPLQPWEADKIPLVCASWRLSNNCEFGAQTCRFMHRNKDPHGRDYPIGDMDGFVPPKYRKPPVTCPFWLNSKAGCRKPDKQCQFAHRNTGWIPHHDSGNSQLIRVDPNQLPESAKPTVTPKRRLSQPGSNLRPQELTCWYWSKGKCRNAPKDCSFQHFDTGVVADPPPSALTCREWATGNCTYEERYGRKCRKPHYHTGIMVDEAPRTTQSAPRLSEQLEEVQSSAYDAMIDAVPSEVIQPHNHNEAPLSPLPIPCVQLPQQTIPPPPSPPSIQFPPAKATCVQLRAKLENICKLNLQTMFASNDGEDVINLLDRRAFLIYHPDHQSEELALLTRWLLMHHVVIGNAYSEGAWQHFQQQIRKGGSGVIIAHPDFDFYTELPEIGQVLRKQVRLWSVGLQEGIEYDSALSDAPPPIRHDCIEIFPLGGLIYITDEVFETKPQLALKIVKLFFAKIEKLKQLAGPLSAWQEVDDAGLLWRLCVRPELMEYLFRYCEDHSRELDASDPDMQSRAGLYTILGETNYIEQDDPVVPLSLIPDKYPVLSERRVIAECEPVDYFNRLARSQEEANLAMIRYYAGLHIDMRRDYRHFFIVHTEPAASYAQQWKQEIQTISEIITPEQCAQELSKKGEESMFDFYVRFMPEYKDKNWKEHLLRKDGKKPSVG